MEKLSVQVKEGTLRATPSFLGKVITSVFYGERLQVVETSDGWSKVRLPGKKGTTGWIHSSALTSEAIVLGPGQTNVKQSASSDELALAGKGFNRQVEGQFKTRNPRVDFTWVDRMEAIRISDKEMEAFLAEGGVYPGKGAS